jgi:WhiB family redox-sensing transcriptional regulator
VIAVVVSNWLERASCRGRDQSWWFAPLDSFEAQTARAVCRSCPVRAQCLDEALELEGEHAYGIRAALDPAQRRALRALRPTALDAFGEVGVE